MGMSVRTRLRKVGESQGILIPAVFLETCGAIGAEIDIRLEGNLIILEPIKVHRNGWFEDYKGDKDIDAWEGFVEENHDSEEWQW
jgi:antitoxin MazE